MKGGGDRQVAGTRVVVLCPADSDFSFQWNFKEILIPSVSRASIRATLMADKAEQSPPKHSHSGLAYVGI